MSNSTGPGDSSLVSGARQQQQSSPALRPLGHRGITPSVERESPRRTNALVSRLPEKPCQGALSLQTPGRPPASHQTIPLFSSPPGVTDVAASWCGCHARHLGSPPFDVYFGRIASISAASLSRASLAVSWPWAAMFT